MAVRRRPVALAGRYYLARHGTGLRIGVGGNEFLASGAYRIAYRKLIVMHVGIVDILKFA